MKRIVCLVIFICGLFPQYVQAEMNNLADFDGNEWREWETIRKYNFISGFMAGTEYVVGNNIKSQEEYDNDYEKAELIYISYIAPDKKKPKITFSRKEVALLLGKTNALFNSSLFDHRILNITNGQICEGLDLLYGDFKNRQIKLRDAIYVVKKQIKGVSPEEVEAVVQFLRAGEDYKNFGIRYINKEGQVRYAFFP